MIRRLTGGGVELEFDSTQRELVLVIEENGWLDLRAVVAGPGRGRGSGERELGGVAEGEEAVQAGLVVHELDMIFLRDDLGAGFFPERDASGVIAMSVRED